LALPTDHRSPRRHRAPYASRVVDLLLATLLLLLGWPFLALVALAVKLQDRGPVLFSQDRLGQHGKVFKLYKFRKFGDDAGGGGPMVTVKGDARMTALGRLLERTKLDELPQLFNILKGEMAFVGPRPESLNFRDLFQGPYEEILEHRPGIFGPNQVNFRNESYMYPPNEPPEQFYRRVLFSKKAEADLAYLHRRNVFTDIYWIFRGFWISITGAVDWPAFFKQVLPGLVLDVFFCALSWVLAALLLFGGDFDSYLLVKRGLLEGLWLLPLFVGGSLLLCGSYTHLYHYFSLQGFASMVKATSAGFILGFLLLLRVGQADINYALLPLSWIICNVLLLLVRMRQRLAYLRYRAQRANGGSTVRSVIIYGVAGGGGAMARWLNEQDNQLAVGFMDDDPMLLRKQMEGLRVLGSERDLPTIHAVYKPNQLWVTFRPDATQRLRLEKTCDQLGMKLFLLRSLEPFNHLERLTGIKE
jgi:lipopolysaccharide/colanic/teichoic acid biosynthesis glycosyltransferase